MPEPRWADVWDVDFGEPIGHEQGKLRPAVVVSSDWFNQTKANVHTVVPFTTTLREIATHYRVEPPEGGLERPSMALCEQIRTASVHRFANRRGRLDQTTMDEIVKRLKVLLLVGAKKL